MRMPKILIVEDEKILREAYTILFAAQKDYDVSTAMNGIEALEFCKKAHYDLILLDLMMPMLDGIGFLKEASLTAKSPDTRVVIMSNLSTGSEIAQALQLGAHSHALKSDLAPKDVMMMVKRELNLR